MHTIRDENAEHFKEIVLYPDYTSTGIWCSCGLGSGRPDENLNIPIHLIQLVEFWNDYWDMASTLASKGVLNIEPVEKEIIEIGRILREQILEFMPCELYEERCKLNVVDYE